MAAKQLSDANPDGTCLGQSPTDKIGFHGVAPIAQQATVADATDATSVIAQCNLVIARLKALGLIASS